MTNFMPNLRKQFLELSEEKAALVDPQKIDWQRISAIRQRLVNSRFRTNKATEFEVEFDESGELPAISKDITLAERFSRNFRLEAVSRSLEHFLCETVDADEPINLYSQAAASESIAQPSGSNDSLQTDFAPAASNHSWADLIETGVTNETEHPQSSFAPADFIVPIAEPVVERISQSFNSSAPEGLAASEVEPVQTNAIEAVPPEPLSGKLSSTLNVRVSSAKTMGVWFGKNARNARSGTNENRNKVLHSANQSSKMRLNEEWRLLGSNGQPQASIRRSDEYEVGEAAQLWLNKLESKPIDTGASLQGHLQERARKTKQTPDGEATKPELLPTSQQVSENWLCILEQSGPHQVVQFHEQPKYTASVELLAIEMKAPEIETRSTEHINDSHTLELLAELATASMLQIEEYLGRELILESTEEERRLYEDTTSDTIEKPAEPEFDQEDTLELPKFVMDLITGPGAKKRARPGNDKEAAILLDIMTKSIVSAPSEDAQKSAQSEEELNLVSFKSRRDDKRRKAKN